MTPAFHRQTESRRPFSGEPEGIAGDIRTFGELIFDFRGRSITESIERLQWVRRGGQPTRDRLRLARPGQFGGRDYLFRSDTLQALCLEATLRRMPRRSRDRAF